MLGRRKLLGGGGGAMAMAMPPPVTLRSEIGDVTCCVMLGNNCPPLGSIKNCNPIVPVRRVEEEQASATRRSPPPPVLWHLQHSGNGHVI
eukprot:gene9750-biopygen5510